MVYDFIIVGSGHAGVTVARNIVKNKKKVLMIDFDDKIIDNDTITNNYTSSRVNQSNFLNLTNSFKNKSNIVTDNFNLIACLKESGLSNIWGGGFYLDKDYCSKNKININFHFLKKKFKITDYSKVIEKKDCKNNFQKYLLEHINKKDINFYSSNYLFNINNRKYYCTKYELNKLKKKKNFIYKKNNFLTYFRKEKKIFYLNTTNFNNNFVLKTKNLILSSGTISTTNLVIKYKKEFNKKIRIYHNPQLALIFLLKKKIINKNYKKLKGEMIYKIKLKNNSNVVGSIGRINKETINSICGQVKFIPSFLIKFILFLLRDRIVIANCFFPNNYSKSHIISNGKQSIIKGVRSNKYNLVKKLFLKKIKSSIKKISLFSIVKELPIGSDIHYTGTLSNVKNKKINYKNLKKENLFVVDGSIIPGNPIFPGGYIINQAFQESLKVKKQGKLYD